MHSLVVAFKQPTRQGKAQVGENASHVKEDCTWWNCPLVTSKYLFMNCHVVRDVWCVLNLGSLVRHGANLSFHTVVKLDTEWCVKVIYCDSHVKFCCVLCFSWKARNAKKFQEEVWPPTFAVSWNVCFDQNVLLVSLLHDFVWISHLCSST